MPESAIQKIPLDLLLPSPYNARRFRTEARIQEIAQSLAAHQQREALRVYPGEGEEQGQYLIVSGITRYLAAKTLGWPALDAIVDPALPPHDPLALVSLSRIYNNTSQETDMDRAAVVADLEKQGYGKREIMRAMGFNTPSKLYKLRAFRELPQAILDIAAQCPKKVTAEFADILKKAVSQLGEDKAVLLAEELMVENLSKDKLTKRLRAECQKMANKPSRASKERSASINRGGVKVGDLRITRRPGSADKKIKLEVSLPADAARSLYAELETLCQKVQEEG